MLHTIRRRLLSSSPSSHPVSRAAQIDHALSRPVARFSTPQAVSGSVDDAFETDRIPRRRGEGTSRDAVYFILGGARVVYASAARLALVKFVASMQPAADVLAVSSIEVPLTGIAEGTTFTIKWRGKPVFVRHRTAEEISREAAVDVNLLRDPEVIRLLIAY
jgi:ubiquinol-cytochrome c reductase iron-sulfur subunit